MSNFKVIHLSDAAKFVLENKTEHQLYLNSFTKTIGRSPGIPCWIVPHSKGKAFFVAKLFESNVEEAGFEPYTLTEEYEDIAQALQELSDAVKQKQRELDLMHEAEQKLREPLMARRSEIRRILVKPAEVWFKELLSETLPKEQVIAILKLWEKAKEKRYSHDLTGKETGTETPK